ncbi:MAG: tRNA lysidine(34) synthetase TilS [Sedimentisphaerales bacterium]|nr:tRNA lysidine(34) synthetase TilS [Sedimentisphaerales bacterium]
MYAAEKMLSQFEKKIAHFAEKEQLFARPGNLLLAISGGADSTALLSTMHTLKAAGIIKPNLLCAHINHLLRGPSGDGDEAFVVAQAGKLGLDVEVRRVNVREYAGAHKLSIETAARQMRMQNLIDIAARRRCTAVATAHQKDDNAETIVQRLARGTGIRGLAGIWPTRTFARQGIRFVRPMLSVTRSEVIQYLRERNLQPREDQTNADCAYRRNYIRHRLLPDLQADSESSLADRLYDLSLSARKYYNLVCDHADEIWATTRIRKENVTIDCKTFSAPSAAVKVELVRRAIETLGSGEKNLTREHYERVLQLARSSLGGRKIELPGRITVRNEYQKLLFEKPKSRPEQLHKETMQIAIPGRTRAGEHLIETTILPAENVPDLCASTDPQQPSTGTRRPMERFVECFDMDRIAGPVVVRPRRNGDRFVPLGMPAEKKVGKFLSDARIGRDMRRKVLVVTDAEKVLWIWPVRMSDRAKVTSRTRKMLRIEITRTPQPGKGKEPEK